MSLIKQRQAICAAVPASAEFSADDMAQMDRLLTACQSVLLNDDAGLSQTQINGLLGSVSNGYGCWLDTVEAAITSADIVDPVDRAALLGSFCMAKSFLFAIGRARQAEQQK